jgi:hypothetical protein
LYLRNRRWSTFSVAALIGLSVLVPAGASAAAAGAPKVTVVATDLNNPRKVFLGPGGTMYVAEGGTGASAGAATGCRGTCTGNTGSITRIDDGRQTRIVTGLSSAANQAEGDAQGPAAVIVKRGTYYVLMQDLDVNTRGVNRLGMRYAGDLISTPPGKAAPKVIANLAAYEAAHNPDRGAGPGAKYAQPPIDSDPYGFVSFRGGFAVVDAAANDLLFIGPRGHVSVLAVFPTQTEKLTARERDELGPNPPRSLQVQSVPTCVTVGPDGALYVGELTGFPYRPGTARVWRVVPGRKPSLYASGFTTISDIAFDGRDLLVLEIAARGRLPPSSPGALIRVSPKGTRTTLLTKGLNSPTGLAVGNGSIYISNNGVYPGSGDGPRGELISIHA